MHMLHFVDIRSPIILWSHSFEYTDKSFEKKNPPKCYDPWKSLAFFNVLCSPTSCNMNPLDKFLVLENFLSWNKLSYFTACDVRNLSLASGPLTAGKEKNPSPSPRVCIIFSWRWDAVVLAICCTVLGLLLSPLIRYLNSADWRHIWAAYGAH